MSQAGIGSAASCGAGLPTHLGKLLANAASLAIPVCDASANLVVADNAVVEIGNVPTRRLGWLEIDPPDIISGQVKHSRP